MSLTHGAQLQASQPASAARRAITRAWPELDNPAAWLVALILVIMPLIANGFLPDRDLRHHPDPRPHRPQPDVPRRLWRHGQPDAAHHRRLRGLHGRGVRRQRQRQYQPGLAVVARDPDVARALQRCSAPLAGALAVRTEGIYTIMITLRDRRGVLLLLHQPELGDLQRPTPASTPSPPHIPWASTGAPTFPFIT